MVALTLKVRAITDKINDMKVLIEINLDVLCPSFYKTCHD